MFLKGVEEVETSPRRNSYVLTWSQGLMPIYWQVTLQLRLMKTIHYSRRRHVRGSDKCILLPLKMTIIFVEEMPEAKKHPESFLLRTLLLSFPLRKIIIICYLTRMSNIQFIMTELYASMCLAYLSMWIRNFHTHARVRACVCVCPFWWSVQHIFLVTYTEELRFFYYYLTTPNSSMLPLHVQVSSLDVSLPTPLYIT